MSCDETRERLSAFLDGEVGETERAVIAVHLETCADCRAAGERLRRTSDALRAWFRETSERGGDEGREDCLRKSGAALRAAVAAREGVTGKRALLRRVPRFGAAAAVLLLAGAFVVYLAGGFRHAGRAARISVEGLSEAPYLQVEMHPVGLASALSEVMGRVFPRAKSPSATLLLSRSGRFVMRLSASTPEAGTDRLPREFRAGFDGRRFWRWMDGETVVRTRERSGAESGPGSLLDEAGVAILWRDWEKVQSLLPEVEAGRGRIRELAMHEGLRVLEVELDGGASGARPRILQLRVDPGDDRVREIHMGRWRFVIHRANLTEADFEIARNVPPEVR